MIALMPPMSYFFPNNRTFETTRRTIGLPSGPCAMVLSMGPPSDGMNNVHSGLENTAIETLTLATTNSPWKMAKLDPRGLLHTVLPMTLQETATGCGALTTNLTTVLSVRAAYKHLNRVDAGATPLISVIPLLEMPPPRRRRRKTGGRGQRTHIVHQDRRRGRRSPSIDQQWETQQTSTRHIHIAPNPLRNRNFRRMRRGELMEDARKETLGWRKEMDRQRHLEGTNSIMSSDVSKQVSYHEYTSSIHLI